MVSWDKDKMVSALHSWHSPTPGLRHWKTMMDKPPKGQIIHVSSLTFQTAGLGCGQQFLAWLLASGLGLGWFTTQNQWSSEKQFFFRHPVAWIFLNGRKQCEWANPTSWICDPALTGAAFNRLSIPAFSNILITVMENIFLLRPLLCKGYIPCMEALMAIMVLH